MKTSFLTLAVTLTTAPAAAADSIPQKQPFSSTSGFSKTVSLDANDLNDHKGDYNPTPLDGMQYDGDNKSGNVSGLVDTIFWDNYIGTGKYDITVSILPWINCGNFDNLEYSAVTPVNTSGYVEVVYNYIPEPATIILMTISTLRTLKKKGR